MSPKDNHGCCTPTLLEYPLHSRTTAFSTYRTGGCSTGSYASFNANAYCGDDPRHVQQNREALCARLGIDSNSLVIPHQVHGTTTLHIDQEFLQLDSIQRGAALEGVDALTTSLPKVCVCVSTADCVPLLLHDPTHGAIAAVHAGWRGTMARIVTHVAEEMHKRYGTAAADLQAVIGPSISLASFEVGDEVYEAFAQHGHPMLQIARRYPAPSPHTTKWHIDLWESNRLQLIEAGVQPEHISTAGICTYLHHDRFFSARRLGIASGRILSGIMRHEGGRQ